jgi:hypothetical protein
MLGEWVTAPQSIHMGPFWERPGDEPLERTERVLTSDAGAQVILRIERVARHWRVIDYTHGGKGPALEGLDWFTTRDAAREAADEWLAAWRAKYFLGVPG